MKKRINLLFGILFTTSMLAGCQQVPLNMGVLTGQNPVLTAEPTKNPVKQTAMANPRVTKEITAVRIFEDDLPAGFMEWTEEDLAAEGMTAQAIAEDFYYPFSSAEARFLSAFSGPNSFNSEFFVSIIISPLNRTEQIECAMEMDDPVDFMGIVNEGEEDEATWLDGSEVFGNYSAGYSYLTEDDEGPYITDVVTFLRGDAIILTMVMYDQNAVPPVDVLTISELLDKRLAAAQE